MDSKKFLAVGYLQDELECPIEENDSLDFMWSIHRILKAEG
jgi:hypothetical protein